MKLNRKDYESSIPLLNKQIKRLEQGQELIIDKEISPTSENPVQNKAIYKAIKTIPKGDPGKPGPPGISPTATITKSNGVTTITIVDATGEKTGLVLDGQVGTFEMEANGDLYYVEPE